MLPLHCWPQPGENAARRQCSVTLRCQVPGRPPLPFSTLATNSWLCQIIWASPCWVSPRSVRHRRSSAPK